MIETDFARTDLWFMLRGAGMTLTLTFWAVLGGTAEALGVAGSDELLHPRKRFYAGGARSVRGFGEGQLGLD